MALSGAGCRVRAAPGGRKGMESGMTQEHLGSVRPDDKQASCEELVSILVPVYGVESFLERCIDSILGQTYRNLEIILVNDGSPDRCGEICDSYSVRDPRITVIHQQNQGISAARNACLDAATGEWYVFVDSDDWIHSQAVECLMRNRPEGVDIVVGGYSEVTSFQPDSVLGSTGVRVISSDQALELISKPGPLAVLLGTLWGKLYRKSLFTSIRFPVGRVHEDAFVCPVLFGGSSSAALLDVSLYYYFRRLGSITMTDTLARRRDRREALRHTGRYLTERGHPGLAQIAYKRAMMSWIGDRVERVDSGDDAADFQVELMRHTDELRRMNQPLALRLSALPWSHPATGAVLRIWWRARGRMGSLVRRLLRRS